MPNKNPAAVPSRELSSIDFGSMIGGPLIAVVEAQAKAAMSTIDYIKSVGFEESPDGNMQPTYVSFTYPKEVSPYIPKIEGTVSVSLIEKGLGYTSPPADINIEVGGVSFNISATVNPDGSVATATINNGSTTTISKSDSKTKNFETPTNGTAAQIRVTTTEAQEAQEANFQNMEMKVPILTMLPTPFIRIEEATIDFNAKINSLEEAKFDTKSKFKGEIEANVRYGSKFTPYEVGVKMKASMSHQKTSSGGYNVQREYTMNVHVRAVNDEMPAGMERLLGILEENIKSTPVESITP